VIDNDSGTAGKLWQFWQLKFWQLIQTGGSDQES
jgi:hypothetical protein